jgi:hypothetical protein
MLKRWADVLASPNVRIILGLIGVVGTVALAPMSVFGAFMLATSLFSDAQDKWMFLGWSLVGTGAVIAIVAAWVRLLVPRRHFQQRPLRTPSASLRRIRPMAPANSGTTVSGKWAPVFARFVSLTVRT